MRPPEKCKLRTLKVGPKRRSNLQKATTYVKLSEKHFFDCQTFPSQALRTRDHRVCKLRLARSLPITPPLTRGNHRSLMSWLAQGHVYSSILKLFEPNPANETTWKIGPLTPSPFGGRNSQVWLYHYLPDAHSSVVKSHLAYTIEQAWAINQTRSSTPTQQVSVRADERMKTMDEPCPFEILSDLNQAVPNHLADESQTC